MHRRDLLLNAALLPLWMRAISCSQDPLLGPLTFRGAAVRDAYARAKQLGKPLLLIVVPNYSQDEVGSEWWLSQPDELWIRGEAWAQLVGLGSPEILADLALCEVACAQIPEAARALLDDQLLTFDGRQPLALLIEPDDSSCVAIEVPLEELPLPSWGGEERKDYRDLALERVGRMSEAIHAALLPEDRPLAGRAAAARAALGETGDVILSGVFGGQLLALTERAPAVLREAAEDSPHRDVVIEGMATATQTAWMARAPDGGEWGEHTGCGIQLPSRPEIGAGVSCGMGHLPEEARRFLYFYTLV